MDAREQEGLRAYGETPYIEKRYEIARGKAPISVASVERALVGWTHIRSTLEIDGDAIVLVVYRWEAP